MERRSRRLQRMIAFMVHLHFIWHPGCHYDVGTMHTILHHLYVRCIRASN